MKYTVSKKFSFEAAHSLPQLPVGHKCRNLHGHSYVVEIYVQGPLDERGFVVDYAEISTAMDRIVDLLDHQNINDILPCSTTAENLGAWIMQQLDKYSGLDPRVCRVDVYETAKTCVKVER
jgi:6-pyruvoyltetrahydropterin/6-carboxytetrahydropterin synthase